MTRDQVTRRLLLHLPGHRPAQASVRGLRKDEDLIVVEENGPVAQQAGQGLRIRQGHTRDRARGTPSNAAQRAQDRRDGDPVCRELVTEGQLDGKRLAVDLLDGPGSIVLADEQPVPMNLESPRTVLRLDDEDPGGPNRDRIDIALGGRGVPVVQGDVAPLGYAFQVGRRAKGDLK